MPRTARKPVAPALTSGGPARLQKLLAAAGLGSRRQCEELILAGRVEVDRQVVSELGAKADPARQEIRVDGDTLAKPRLVYFAVNKPTGVVSTSRDPSGRARVIDLVPYPGRLFTVGRLDMSSEGLILVTNDGDLADHLTHPRYRVEKTYQVEVAGAISRTQLESLRKGVHLAEGFARTVSARVVRSYKQSTLLEIVLAEGRNREIRRILARVGHKVVRLRRVAIGPLRLGPLPAGECRSLTPDEVRQLKRFARNAKQPPGKRRKQTRSADGPSKATAAKGRPPKKRGSDSKSKRTTHPAAGAGGRRKSAARSTGRRSKS